ncbi:hypothetical protein PGTUg99_025318 [Puccinia graminis f. sp. tritici]|uniref:Uncharacterized protein n=1 Tax=Puccinia graminis f. sp. tritici TaxID=56615 RepID=A0A5B0S0N3_PUCGR|nr:hypothetical protein PGTUg99_025318 [Puccinia graminis f. sp. tritici]
MAPAVLSAMPNRPYRVSSRAALTSPSLPLTPANASPSNWAPSLHPRSMASQASMDISRGEQPPRTPKLSTQLSHPQTEQSNAGPQLPQLLPSKPAAAPNRGVYNKLKSVRSFFRRNTTESEDESDGFDTGRGADPSTISESGYSSSKLSRPRALQPSPNIGNASHHRATPSPTPTESFVRPRASSSKARPLGMTNDLNKQFNRVTQYVESKPQALPLQRLLSPNPHSPSQSVFSLDIQSPTSPCASHDDSTPTRKQYRPSRPQKSFDLARATLHPDADQVTPKPSFSAPRVPNPFQNYSKQAAIRSHKAQSTEDSPDKTLEDHHTRSTVRRRSRSPSSTHPAQQDGDTYSGDDASGEIGRSEYSRSVDDLTTESFEINVAQELKPAAACKLILTEPGNSSLAISRGASSAGSSVRSSSISGFTNSGSTREEYTSPCSSLPSPNFHDGEDYVNIRQIKQVMQGLQSLLEKLDPQDLSDPSNRVSADGSSCPHSRINHSEFLRMIKYELER